MGRGIRNIHYQSSEVILGDGDRGHTLWKVGIWEFYHLSNNITRIRINKHGIGTKGKLP